ncbi:MAG: hypothetical protein ACRBN8_33420 [Nannocystales bacterium]
MLRIISALVVEGMISATTMPPARLGPATTARVSKPADPVDALHRSGEELFDAGDYAGARVAWTQAYERVAAEESTWPYRTTLLSLIVTTTLSEFSGGGDRAPIREAADLIDAALASELEDEIRSILEDERERLSPYLDPVPSPAEAPPPADDGSSEDPTGDARPQGDYLIPSPVWAASGGVLLAGGLTALIVGSRFGPRATDQVTSAGDSTTMSPGSTFIQDERRKGTGWMVAGGAVAAVGVTALVIGIVRLARHRNR